LTEKTTGAAPSEGFRTRMSLVAYHEKETPARRRIKIMKNRGFLKKDRTPLEGGVRSVQFAI
jgi:hypothetical protein